MAIDIKEYLTPPVLLIIFPVGNFFNVYFSCFKHDYFGGILAYGS